MKKTKSDWVRACQQEVKLAAVLLPLIPLSKLWKLFQAHIPSFQPATTRDSFSIELCLERILQDVTFYHALVPLATIAQLTQVYHEPQPVLPATLPLPVDSRPGCASISC